MNGWRPLIVYVLNILVGVGVTQGHVDPAQKDYLVESLADVVGLAIVLASSIAAIVHTFKKPHDLHLHKPVAHHEPAPTTGFPPLPTTGNTGTPPLPEMVK